MPLPWKFRAIFRPIDRNAPIELQVDIETWRRRLIWLTLLGVFLIGLAFTARPGLRAVKGWHARRLVVEAEGLMAERNWSQASDRIRDAFTFAPGEPSVILAAARLANETGATALALDLWTRACELPGALPEHRVELALAIVRAGRPPVEAATQLAQAGAAVQTSRGRYVSAALAFRNGDHTGALQLLREAVRLDPKNSSLKVQLASPLVYRAATDKAAAAEAALLLYELRKEGRETLSAGRLLRQLRLQAGDLRRAREEALAVIATDGSGLEDRLQLAEILRRQGDRSALDGLLSPLLAESLRSRGTAAIMSNWLLDQQQVNDAARLLEKVSPDWRRVPPLSLTYARHLDNARRINDLREHLRTADWTGAEPEREAWNARLAQLQNNERLRVETWSAVEKRAVGNRELLVRLLAVAKPWRWHQERIRLLHQLAAMPPVDQLYLEEWRQAALAVGQTVDLCEATWQLLDLGTNDPTVRSDAARSALALGRRLEDARKLAAEVYLESPGQPDLAATQAAALRSEGKLEEAQRVLAPWIEMAARGGTIPDRIAYERAANLAAAGDAKGAAAAAKTVQPEVLLPEERAQLRKLLEL